MVARFNLNVDQSIQMDGTMKVVWYPSREGEWVRYTDYADRIAELEATIKKVEAVGFEVHDSWGVSEEFYSGWIACRAQVELALLGEAK